jgi:hypothetical protein
MMPVEYRRTRQSDIHRFGQFVLQKPARFYGLTAWCGRRAVGMGGVAKPLDGGPAWGYVFRAPGFEDALGKGLHRRALRFLAALRRCGIRVETSCDETVPRASEWLARLGFVATDRRYDGAPIFELRH